MSFERSGSRILPQVAWWLNLQENLHDRIISEHVPFQMGLQVSRHLHSQTSPQGAVWESEKTLGCHLPRTGTAERMPHHRRTLDARSRSHVHLDPAEICGGIGDRLHQGQIGHRDCSTVSGAGAQLHGRALLGAWVLCLNCWVRRREKCAPTSASKRVGTTRGTFSCPGSALAVKEQRN